MTFRYRGEARWSGPWDNPNEYGVLMAVGVVLAAGLLVAGCKLQVAGWRAVAWRWLTMLSIVVGAVATGAGLFKSYSRGAWLGAVCGLGFLAWRWVNHGIRERHALQSAIRNPQSAIARCGSCVLWFRRNGLAFALVLVSLFVVAFWSLRQTEFAPVRRLFSAGNVNDISWRNRVDAWEGAVQIMAGKPWLGWGWTRPEQIYDHYYRAARLEEGMAIQLNDFFTLGMALGMPALGCFAVFVWLSVLRSAECGVRNLSDSAISGFGFRISDFLPAVCRAGAIVLLLGFWFDGGLFKLHLATPFWILLSLGAVRRPQVES
jgi:hypothetical protein